MNGRVSTVIRTSRPFRRGQWWKLSAVTLVVMLMTVGCGGEPESTVSGKVTYHGKPVTEGVVGFYSASSGHSSEAKLNGDGTFALPGTLPPGSYKVYVRPPIPEQLPPGTPTPKPSSSTIPPQYQDIVKTPLTKDVAEGANEFSITFTD